MHKDTFFQKNHFINLRGKLFDLAAPRVMGILNVTPDSFYDGGYYQTKHQIEQRLEYLLKNGSDFIDVGAYSSRPHAEDISAEEEFNRLKPALELLRKNHPEAIISVDTFRSAVAKRALSEFNVDIINDISAGMLDPAMIDVVAEYQVPYIIMHMPGNPRTMQSKTQYQNVTRDIIQFLGKQSSMLRARGVKDIIIDPGFGFGKTVEQNFELLAKLKAFRILELPLLAGVSRKSMIYKSLDITADKALNGTTALHMLALERGANILRVHDVIEAKQTIRLFQLTCQAGSVQTSA